MVRPSFFRLEAVMKQSVRTSTAPSLVPSHVSRASRFASSAAVIGAIGLFGGLVLAAQGCSSATVVDPGPAVCDSTKCAAGNTCIELAGESKCRKTCSSNTDATKACPSGFLCTALAAQEAPCTGAQCYCAEAPPETKAIQKKDKGQWGSACNPTGGIAANPDCDAAQGFQCYARYTSDGNAYCTRACTDDKGCGAGFFCGDVNDTPNAETVKREGTGTVKICQKRDYCAPCKASLDCPTGQLCAGAGSPGAFCTATCQTDTNCAVDAFCSDYAGAKYCFPNAGACVGDGKFCSPCRSDLDCKAGGGICASSSAYTTERFCTVPSPSKCASNGDCPARPDGVAASGCTKEASDDIPAGSCVGLFTLDKNPVPGCYTRSRK